MNNVNQSGRSSCGVRRAASRILALLGPALLWATCSRFQATEEANKAAIARIEEARGGSVSGVEGKSIAEIMAETHTPGLSVAVIKDFKILWVKSYGIADAATNELVTKKTLFQAASISKTLAAMATLSAVQEGKFRLDDDINSLLKSWKLPENDLTKARHVTPRMLLSHTGGTTIHGFPGYRPDAERPTLPQILSGIPPANTKAVFVDTAPFTKSNYSGGGVTIMQLAMTEMLGKPMDTIIAERVLKPIGMTDSAFDQPPQPVREPRTARAHDAQGKTREVKYHVYPETSAAGLWTTPADLAKFAIEIQLSLRGKANHVLNDKTTRLMVTPVGVGPFGLGFEMEQRGADVWYFGHSGGNWGFRCDLLAHREGGYGAVLMTNGDSGNTVIYEMRKRIAKEYHWVGDFDAKPLNWGKDD